MPKRYWGLGVKSLRLGIWVTLAVLICASAWSVYSYIHDNERSNAAANHAYLSFLECIEARPSSPSICRAQAEQSKYKETAEYYDLKAQQDMAKWALLMLIVTAVGVGYVALTLQETRKANEGFRESSERQLRAYIHISRSEVHRFAVGQIPLVGVVFKNAGQTPAYQVQCRTSIQITQIDPEQFRFRNWFNHPSGKSDIGPGEMTHHKTPLVDPNGDKINAATISDVLQGRRFLVVGVVVTYRDAFGKLRRTISRVTLDPSKMEGGFAALTNCNRNNRAN